MPVDIERIADAAARVPARRRHGRNLPAGHLTPRERKFIDALIAGADSYTEAWTIATGIKGRAAQVGGSRAMSRPEVAAALIEDAKKRMAIGAAMGVNEILRLMRHSKSDYVRADVAKYATSAAGLGPRADTKPAGGTPITINIDISDGPKRASAVHVIDVTPQEPDEQR